MTEPPDQAPKGRVERLIAFLKTLGSGKSSPGDAFTENGAFRNQSEAEYQEEQARWLAEIAAIKTGKPQSR